MISSQSLPHIFDSWHSLSEDFRRADSVLLGFDFDGTLSPIVDDPDKASITPDAHTYLKTLLSFLNSNGSNKNGIVTILSGRSLVDLQKRAALPNAVLAGDHGLNILLPDGTNYRHGVKQYQNTITSMVSRLRRGELVIPGIIIEPKDFSVTVHYRRSPAGSETVLEKILRQIIKNTSFNLHPGRKCWELHLDLNWDKGSAFNWIKEKCFDNTKVLFELYIGDDRTDEDVFAQMQSGGYPILIQSLEKKGKTNAQYCLRAQTEVVELLNRLVDLLSSYQKIKTD